MQERECTDKYMQGRQRRERHVFRNLLSLFTMLAGLIGLYLFLDYKENQKVIAGSKYQLGEQVKVDDKIGIISNLSTKRNGFGNKTVTYSVQFSNFEEEIQTYEDVLTQTVETVFSIGDIVELYEKDDSNQYLVDSIVQNEDGSFVYLLVDGNGEAKGTYDQDELAYVLTVPLDESYSAAENNAIIQNAINESVNYSHTILEFPQGSFVIGSSNPDQEYILLASNIEMRSNDTTLVVEGSSRWFALATGPSAIDGVVNFEFHGFNVISSDLESGSQFIIMANHGYNWQVYDNIFTMVHQRASHIFDLGGVQSSRFYRNKFVGYAPDLTHVTEIGDSDLHDFYAEAIQTDYSDDNGIWDGGMIAAIDENYATNNVEQILSSDIEIFDNELLPYYNSDGDIVAYAATLGQHSSKVGSLSINNNVIAEPLVYNYDIDLGTHWYFTPVHAQSDIYLSLDSNHIKTS